MNATVSERLVQFARHWQRQGVPETVRHEARRLVLNQLKASVAASEHQAVRILHDWARDESAGSTAAHALWIGTPLSPACAAIVNGAQFEVLDFHDTYIPCFMHAVSAVLPALLACAEESGANGRDFVTALALGLEIELGVATILMPTGYYRGAVPAGLAGGLGAAAACGLLLGLDDTQLRNALGLAMTSAFGLYETVGSMALSYITGATARSGLTAAQLARRGFDAPRTAFEGEKGMLATHTDENAGKIAGVLDSMGQAWRIFGQTYKVIPTETITHGPVECTLALLQRRGARELASMRFEVAPIVVKIADERRERFGNPDSELTARFDLRHCVAAAWLRGRFTLDEMRAATYTDPAVLALRDRVELLPDPARPTFDGCRLTIDYRDGSSDRINIDDFLGSPGNRISDEHLAKVFRESATNLLPAGRADAISAAVWALDDAVSLQPLMQLARLS